jgi:hypothetical protein
MTFARSWLLSIGFATLTVVLLVPSTPGAQDRNADAARRKLLDDTLDLYVRDGLVYYRALQSDRSRLDRYVSGLATASIDALPVDERKAFWLNAYNAVVLRTVIDAYPIATRSKEYPAGSIRQIPGAFERRSHRIAGRTLTLDEIEQTVLPGFDDPRLYLALGRGAVGSGRLRSEAFDSAQLDRQLGDVARECTTRAQCVFIDRSSDRVLISSIFSWRQEEFVKAYAPSAETLFNGRSPIERAMLALIAPGLLTIEREFLARNTFAVEYTPFDWALNDLTGRTMGR